MRDVIDAGLHPSNHTDFVVAPLDQMMMLHSAVNRVSRKGSVIGKGQQVTPFEALKSMTIWVAEQYGEQDTKGTLASGKLADLVILDKDPIRVDPSELKNIRVLETIKEGVTIYPANTSTPGITAPEETSKQTYRWRAHICDMAEVNQAVGKDWVLASLNEQKINVEMPPTLRFEHGRITLFGGVNRISGSYALIQDSVTLGDLVGTKRAGPPELMELENSLAETLAAVNGFHVQGDSMELLSSGKVVARFQTAK
jgi:heat shock protein HslJ